MITDIYRPEGALLESQQNREYLSSLAGLERAMNRGAIVEGIAAKTALALERSGCHTLVLAGGVAANSHLRRRLQEVAQQYGATVCVPPISLCGDNGAMVAAAGYFEFLKGNLASTDLNASAEDPVCWGV